MRSMVEGERVEGAMLRNAACTRRPLRHPFGLPPPPKGEDLEPLRPLRLCANLTALTPMDPGAEGVQSTNKFRMTIVQVC